tara:strand:+ start:223 stop:345 length:123 start_codon:yes stop_codon:yes gene_type:complete
MIVFSGKRHAWSMAGIGIISRMIAVVAFSNSQVLIAKSGG